MKKILIDRAILLVEKIHLRVFGHPISSEMKKFIGNLSWSFAVGILVMPLLVLFTTLAGRLIGPVEYGKYSLLLVVNQFLVIFIFFGLDTTTVKYIAKAQSFEKKRNIISASSRFIFGMLILMAIIALLIFPFLNKISKSYSIFIVLLTAYTFIVSLKLMFDLFIRGLEDFRMQAKGKVVEVGIVTLAFILFFLILKRNNFASIISILNSGAAAIAIYYFFSLKKYFGKTKKIFLSEQLGEAKLFFIYALLWTLFISADRLVVGRYLGIRTLGIYSAYYAASLGVVSQLTQLFTNVFFSVTSRLQDKTFTKKIDKILLIGLIPLTLVIILIMLVMLFIFGKEYPLNLLYVVGFSLFSSLYFFQSLYNTVIADVPREEYGKYLMIRNIINFGTIAIYFLFAALHFLSVIVVLTALVLNSVVSIVIQRLFIRKMQCK